MAIQPLQLPGPLIVPKIDWSPLNDVGDAYVKNQERQREAAALGGLVESIPTSGAQTMPTATPSASQAAPPSSSPGYPRTPYSNAVGLMLDAAPPEIAKDISITSGLRTNARQAELYDAAVKKYGSEEEARKWVAPPGQSQHEKGNAADLQFGSDEARQWAHDNAGKYGLTFPLAKEPWHVETAGARSNAQGAGQPGQLPLGLRNNNPGYIPDGAIAKALPGYKGAEGGYAAFETPEHGLGAMDALLTSFGRRGIKTGGEIVRQLPGTDSSNADAMARFVSPNGDPNAPVDLSDPAQRQQMVGRMAIFANGMHGGMGMAAPAAPLSQAQMAEAAGGMTPDMKKRVQALFAVGSPTATAAGMALISKYVGKQEYGFQMGPEGLFRTNPTTGTAELVAPSNRIVTAESAGPFGTNVKTSYMQGPGGLTPIHAPGGGPVTPSAAPPGISADFTKVDPNWNDNEKQVYASAKPGEQGAAAYGIKLARGQAPLPTGQAMRTPWGQGVMDAAQAADPTFIPMMAGARAATYTDYFKGGTSQNIKALNTLPRHMEDFAKTVDNLPMVSGLGPLNKTANELVGGYMENAQTPDWAAAKAKILPVATELGKAMRGPGVLGKQEVDDWLHTVKLAATPEAMRAALGGAINMVGGRIDTIQSHWDKTMGPNNKFEVMDPGALEAWDRVQQWSRGDIRGDKLKSITPGKGAAGPTPAVPAATQPTAIPAQAVDLLKGNPALAPQFDAKYGPGSAVKILGAAGDRS